MGGYSREQAIMHLRRFYLTENIYAPNPRSKANRKLKTDFQREFSHLSSSTVSLCVY